MVDMLSAAVNPLRAGMRSARAVAPATMVIFGATGDLTRRKLIPALYDLACVGCMSPHFDIVGIGRKPLSDEEFRSTLEEVAALRTTAGTFSRPEPADGGPCLYRYFVTPGGRDGVDGQFRLHGEAPR